MFGWDFLLMLSQDSEDEMWSRFMFELLTWLQEVTLARWTQPLGPLCLWQCFFLSYYSLSRRTWVRLLRDLFNAKKYWRDKNTAKKFLRHKVIATKLLRGPQNHWEMKLWQQNCQWYFKVLHLRGGWQHETEIISSQTPLIFTSWHKDLQLFHLAFHICLIKIKKT